LQFLAERRRRAGRQVAHQEALDALQEEARSLEMRILHTQVRAARPLHIEASFGANARAPA
jgi:hypothetical protein